MTRVRRAIIVGILAVAALVTSAAAVSMLWHRQDTRAAPAPSGLTAARALPLDQTRGASSQVLFPTHIHRPNAPPTVTILSEHGDSQTVSCVVCHSMREPDFTNRTAADFDQFHQNMNFAHGDISCLSCHNPDDYNTLRLADQRVVTYRDVMTLCAQCHGPQYRDYLHGAHGGMNGYWDLSKGPRTRNNCIDCHNPHAPKFPTMKPNFKPRDRFLESHDSGGGSTHD